MNPFTLAELAAEAEREVRMRERVYPRGVLVGRMTEDRAERKLAMMAEIARRLRTEAEAEAQGRRL